jgi:chemotaxis protein MotB
VSNHYDIDLIGDETPADSGDGEPWMTSYLDIMTLLFAFFVMLMSMSEIRTEQVPIITIEQSLGSPMGTEAVIVDEVGVAQRDTGIAPMILPGATDSTAVVAQDQYASQFGELQNNLNALDLQGVNATPGREGLTLRIADNLLFASAQAELMTEGMQLISQLIQVLADFEGEISIEGHTDNIPISTDRFPSNWELSSARAISVLKFLEQDGIAANRMRAIGYAETRPLQDNESAQGRAANRRVELILREP